METKECDYRGGYLNGFLMIAIDIVLWGLVIYNFINGCIAADAGLPCLWQFVTAVVLFVAFFAFNKTSSRFETGVSIPK